MTARLLIHRLSRDRGGLAMIEFALAAPVLLTLVLAGLETSNLVLAHMRISRIASMTADNASRVRDTIDEEDVNELMQGAQLASGTYDIKTNGRVILSDLQPNNAATGQWIRWQRCYGTSSFVSSYGKQGKGISDATLQAMGPAGRQIAAASGTSVMFVEVRYNYTPLIAGIYGSSRTISYTSAYNVRKRPNADITNVDNLTAANKSAC